MSAVHFTEQPNILGTTVGRTAVLSLQGSQVSFWKKGGQAGEMGETRILPWPAVKDRRRSQCVRGAHLQSAQAGEAARRDVVTHHPSAVLMFEQLEDMFSFWREASGSNAYVIHAGVEGCCCLSHWLVASLERLRLPKVKQKSTGRLW